MGETTIWGYIALLAVILGFAYGLWRQKHVSKRKAAKMAASNEQKETLEKNISDLENK